MSLHETSSDWFEQQDHERMKTWMQEHGWSCVMSADPADIYEILEAYNPDEDDLDAQENALNVLSSKL